jgi:serine/threonine protein kinase
MQSDMPSWNLVQEDKSEDPPVVNGVDADNLNHGYTILDQYCIDERVGDGGCSVIYRATDDFTGEHVALKVYRHNTSYNTELGFLQLCNHGNIVKPLDYFEGGSFPNGCVVLPLGDRSLHAVFTQGRPINSLRIKEIMHILVHVLAHFREREIVHCDLKPSNIMLFKDAQGVPTWKIIDFDAVVLCVDSSEY